MLTNAVHDFRHIAGLTQAQLAEQIGVTRQTIIAIEKGNYVPSVVLALRLARVFSVPVEGIFNESNQK
jgi:putative transcriptional regulator